MNDYDKAPTNPHHGGKMMPHQYCPDCGEEVDEYGDTTSSARDCSYCPVQCNTCGNGSCDQSC